jgi:precorrin-4/cobalt-precorrin-4 C11-methyltransferase
MTVHFIGAGPGAADLLTVRAVRLLNASPVCLYAGTYVTADVLAHCPAGAELIDTARLDLDQITEHLVSGHRAGHDVARLCSGDPSLYSALHEQTRLLDIAGIPWDVTPGVPAYAAAAAILGVELTMPELAQTVILTRAQARSTAMPDAEKLENLAATGATLVLHLAITQISGIAIRLVPFYGADCPVDPARRGCPGRHLARYRWCGRGGRPAAGGGDHGRARLGTVGRGRRSAAIAPVFTPPRSLMAGSMFNVCCMSRVSVFGFPITPCV